MCPGAAAALEQAYNVASQQDRGGRFVMNQQLLGNGEGGGGGWQAGPYTRAQLKHLRAGVKLR